jgi:hypothetical protein
MKLSGRLTSSDWLAGAKFEGDDWRPAGWSAASCLIVGLGMGVLWALLAPRPEFQVSKEGLSIDPYSQVFVAADMIFGLLGAACGVVLAVGWLRFRPESRTGILAGLSIGGILGSAVAWRVGEALAGGGAAGWDALAHSAVGASVVGPLQLAAKGTILLWSFTAATVVLIAATVRTGRVRRELDAVGYFDAGA